MSTNHETRRRRPTTMFWSFPQATKAMPFIASILRSLREHSLEIRVQRNRAAALAAQPGRPNRTALLAQAGAQRAVQQAESAYDDAARELAQLGIHCDDPMQGLARIPTTHSETFAWILFDLFAEVPLRAWRYHNDAPEIERPISDLLAANESATPW